MYFLKDSGSSSSGSPESVVDLTLMCFERLETKLKLERAFSSIEPIELYTKKELISTAKEKIRMS